MVTVKGNTAEFTFYRPQAQKVTVVGDFNHWAEAACPMGRTSDGYWKARIRLQPGSYHFRYYADGQWYTDYAAFGIEYGRFGPNAVLRIA